MEKKTQKDHINYSEVRLAYIFQSVCIYDLESGLVSSLNFCEAIVSKGTEGLGHRLWSQNL